MPLDKKYTHIRRDLHDKINKLQYTLLGIGANAKTTWRSFEKLKETRAELDVVTDKLLLLLAEASEITENECIKKGNGRF